MTSADDHLYTPADSVNPDPLQTLMAPLNLQIVSGAVAPARAALTPMDQLVSTQRTEVTFIESNVGDLQTLIQGLGPNAEVHILNAGEDGLQQIAAILAGRSGIDALHIISHGDTAAINLGVLQLDSTNLDAHGADLQAIGNSMAPNGDIMLYGCDVAQGSDGAAFVDRLAVVSGADVAASSNLTGSAALGGDWKLEVSSGHIETQSVVTPQMANLYHSALAITSANVTFANSANFTNMGGYGASNDVIYKVGANPAYQLKVDGASTGVVNFGGAYVIGSATANDSAITFSFQAGQVFSIGAINLTNADYNTPSQNLVFSGFDASNNLISTNNYILPADTSGNTPRSVTLTGMTEIAKLTVTATNNGNTIQFLQINSLALSNIHAAPPAAPSTPSLASGSDTGTSASDNLTKTAAPTFTGTAEAGSLVNLYDGTTQVGSGISNGIGGWSITARLGAGVHTIVATATDLAGNVSSASTGRSITVDTTAPTLAISSSASTLKIGENAGITFTFSEDPGATFTWDGSSGDVTVTGGTLGAISGSGLTRTATFTPTASTDGGSASISVAASTYTDTAGNNGGAGSPITLSYDTLAPPAPSTPALASASDSGISNSDAITDSTTPTFSGTAAANSTIKLYDSNGTTVVGTGTSDGSGSWSITTVLAANGVHTVRAKATDMAGNTSNASGGTSVTIDTTAPTLAITSSVATLKTGETAAVTFTFSEDPGAGFTWDGSSGSVTVTGGTLGAISGSGLTRTATFTPTASTNIGNASISVAASSYTDKAGNAGGAGSPMTISYDTLTPATPSLPVLASASDSGVSNSDAITNILTPTLTGTAEAGTTVKLYDTNGTTLLGTTVATGGTWSITSNTLAEGAHALKAAATDAAGNVSVLSFGLAVTIDTTAPAPPSGPILAAASDSGTLGDGITSVNTPSVSGTADANSKVSLYDSDGTTMLGTTTASGTGAWSVVSNTLSLGSHTLTVKQTDIAGNASVASAALTLSIIAVPSAPGTPSAPSNLVDGVPVVTTTVVLPGGVTGTLLTIPTVPAGAGASVGAANVADIPLVTSGSTVLLTSQVPIGTGLTSSGGPSQPAASASSILLAAIQSQTTAHDLVDQSHLASNGTQFLALLSSTVPVLVNTIVVQNTSSSSTTPLTLTGTSTANQHTALVIDTSQVTNSVVVLQQVDFAAVVGSAAVTGSTAGQILTGDVSNQTFIIASNSVASQVYAGGGNDVLQYGLTTTLATATAVNATSPALLANSSNAGSLTAATSVLLNGGSGSDTAVFSKAQSAYSIDQRDGYVLVTDKADATQRITVTNTENLKFSDSLVSVASRAELTSLAGFYQTAFGRQADINGFDFWGAEQAKGFSLGEIAVSMLGSNEATARGFALNGDMTHDITVLYRATFGRDPEANGLAYWKSIMTQGQSIIDVANGFMAATEMNEHKLAVTGWDMYF